MITCNLMQRSLTATLGLRIQPCLSDKADKFILYFDGLFKGREDTNSNGLVKDPFSLPILIQERSSGNSCSCFTVSHANIQYGRTVDASLPSGFWVV